MLAGTGLLDTADDAVREAERDRPAGHAQGDRRRWRHRHAGRATIEDEVRDGLRPGGPPGRGELRLGRRLPRAVRAARPGTSRCRSSATATAGSPSSATATARCSAATRRSSRRRRHRRCPMRVRAAAARVGASLAASVDYRSAGTVEFVYDPVREEASFLEVNTRLQVEHPVTEVVYGVDLVELMLRLARDGAGEIDPRRLRRVRGRPDGVAVEARVYAEDPAKDSAPSSGLVTRAVFPGQDAPALPDVRVDGWIETGLEVSPFYDPMLAKVIAPAPIARRGTRPARRGPRREPRRRHRDQPRTAARPRGRRRRSAAPTHSTSTLRPTDDPDPRIDVLEAGAMTTVQDLPGRIGLLAGRRAAVGSHGRGLAP